MTAEGGDVRAHGHAAPMRRDAGWDEMVVQIRRDQRDGWWRGAVAAVAVIGVVVATSQLVGEWGMTVKNLTTVTHELAQLRQQVKDRDVEVKRARARIARGEKALLSKEVEIAELKEQFATHLSNRAAVHTAQLAACDIKDKGDSKLYEESMTCEKKLNAVSVTCDKKLNAVKDDLLKRSRELSQKKREFRKFLSMLQSTWDETKTLKEQIDALESQKADSVLEGAMAAEAVARKESGSDGLGTALSTEDRVLKLLGMVQTGQGKGKGGSKKGGKSDVASTEAQW